MAIENIDIGGPAMIRASAKNFYTKTIVTDPNDYDLIIKELKMNSGSTSFEVRKNLSLSVLKYLSSADSVEFFRVPLSLLNLLFFFTFFITKNIFLSQINAFLI